MINTSWLLLDTPIAYLAAIYFVAYRHDLARLVKPFHDLPQTKANWYAVCKMLELEGADVKPPAAPPMGGTRNLVLLTASASVFAVSIFTSQALPWYYLCALQALVALPVFVVLVVNRTGPFPFRPYRDVLPYPRLGTRVRHLGGKEPDKDAAPAKSATVEGPP